MVRDGHRWLRTYLGHSFACASAPRRALRPRCPPIMVQLCSQQPYFDAALLQMPTITSSTSTAAMRAPHEAHVSGRLPCVRVALGPHVSLLLTSFSHRRMRLAATISEPTPPSPQRRTRRSHRPLSRRSLPPRSSMPPPAPPPAVTAIVTLIVTPVVTPIVTPIVTSIVTPNVFLTDSYTHRDAHRYARRCTHRY